MPNRIIREAILSSERMASLTFAQEVFYRRLMSVTDDYGRHEANQRLLRSKCYPLQTDDVSVKDIGEWLLACNKAGLIVLYSFGDKHFLEIQNFGQQQRTPSKCPAPLDSDISCEQMIANAHLGVVVCVSEGVGVEAPAPASKASAKPKPKAPAATRLPDDFGVSSRVAEWASEKGFDRLADHLEAFARKAKAKGYTYVDWDSAFMEAIREDWAKIRGGGFNGAPPADKPRQRRELGA